MDKTSAQLREYILKLQNGASGVAWQEPYAPGKWRRVELLGHLVDSAMNNLQRFVRALIQDSVEFPSYAQEEFVKAQRYELYAAEELLKLWVQLNQLIAHVMEQIPEEKLSTECRIGTNEPVTLEFLVTDYNRHLKHHLQQLISDVGF